MSYVTGKTIKTLREKRKLTQKELAEKISVSDKTVSKWETGKGLPDIGIIEELARALGVSIGELLTGEYRENENMSGNMKKVQFYICPVCGNIITSVGSGSCSCCGITLPKQEPEEDDGDHLICIETVDNEYHVAIEHPMDKEHYIMWIAQVSQSRVTTVKLYPEGSTETRFPYIKGAEIYAYCNKHGLWKGKVE